jgi:glycosyltransferase involved in cell wall biosynthesis
MVFPESAGERDSAHMRVALDAAPLTLSSGGLRRYTEELSSALAAAFPQDVYTLTAPRPGSYLDKRWWLIGAPLAIRRLNANVFHGTNFETPLLKLRPSVMTLHDLSPWKTPAWHTNAGRVRGRTPWLFRLRLATMAITPTEAVRREAIERFQLSPDRVRTVPHGPSSLPPAEPETSPARPYFLFVGTIEPRKNLEMLVEAWRALPAHTADLVLAGRRRADGPVFGEVPGLRILGEVSDRQLAQLYSAATAFIYPSHYEGFGLPLLEAMQCGAPAIVSGDPALQEVSGGAAMRADSAQELAELMRTLLGRPDLASHYRELGFRRAAEFSWRRTAYLTREVYGEAIARFR